MNDPEGFAQAPLGMPATPASPSAEAVAVVAQRLAAVAEELEALRVHMLRLDGVDWNSQAAAQFRASLAEHDSAFRAVRLRLQNTVELVGAYGSNLRAVQDAGPCMDARWQGGSFTPRF